MKDYLYFIFVLIVILALTLTGLSKGDELASCKSTLHLCNDYAYKLENERDYLKDQIDIQNEYIKNLEKDVAPAGVPWYSVLVTGIVIGVTSTLLLRR